jgi:hypothetical protein
MNGIVLLAVTLLSAALAAVMSAFAWRVAREERRRAEARILALAAEIHGEPATMPDPIAATTSRAPIGIRAEPPRRNPAPPQPAPASIIPIVPATSVIDDLTLRDAPVSAVPVRGDLFAAPDQATPSGVRFAAAAAVGILAVGTAAALAVVLGTGPRTAPAKPAAAPAATDADTLPLELVALGHDRDGDRLTVRGVVRNPAGGAPIDRLVAVVFVFNRDGGFVTSARASVEAAALRPGGESPFVVTLAGAGDVSRYRVSFRIDERVVPHIDKRDRSAMARVQ